MKMRKFIGGAVAAVILAGSVSPMVAQADGKKERYLESQYRHDMMEHAKYMAGNMMQLLKGQAAHEGHIEKLADILALSASMTKASFEKDTRGMEGHTEAKDAIWENWEEFAEAADKYSADAAAFAVAAKSGDKAATGKAFGKAMSNCKSCHDKYKDG
ncbi:MAG: cytochrome c [Kordiimonas sp.]